MNAARKRNMPYYRDALVNLFFILIDEKEKN
jgi:hypothetical protein